MLLFSINTFWSLTQALSTLRKVWVARLTAMLIASSKLCSEMALISVTRATVIEESPFFLPLSLSRVSYPLSRRYKSGGVILFGGGYVVARVRGSFFLTFHNSKDTRPLFSMPSRVLSFREELFSEAR